MAKKNSQVEDQQGRRTRKDELLERKQAEQLRNIRMGAIVIGVLLAAVILIAVVNEYILSPQREVATVGESAVTLSEFQDRVRFERAQRIITLEDQLELFNDDVGMIQQFAGQTINELQSPEALGEAALDRLTQNRLIMQALESRGIEISDAEIDARIAESFSYFGGESPTPVPTPTQAPDPTPSVTPIGGVESEGPVAPEGPEPESPPAPTATPVSEEAFQQELGDFMARFSDLGVDESVYRELVAESIAAEKLLDVLAEEEELPEEDIHASALLISVPTEEEAQELFEQVKETDFLTVWNTVNSTTPDPEAETVPATASEILWQTEETLANSLSPEELAAMFTGPIDLPSGIITIGDSEEDQRFVILMPTGRESRPLSESEFRQRQVQLLTAYLTNATDTQVEIGEYWRSRVPTQPILNPKFLQAPTPAPATPTVAPVDTGATE